MKKISIDEFVLGNCITEMSKMPDESVDMIFADPPYNLQLGESLTRPDSKDSLVKGVNNDWDKFDSFKHYDNFTAEWLKEAKRILKPNGTIWVIGSYHNIFRVGSIIQNMDFWILNDVVWVKSNPMPNFRGTRLTNAHETLIWASKSKESKYTFNYHALKAANENTQMRSDWNMPICMGSERLKDKFGNKIHPTQKPESLLYRVILSSTNKGDVVLDPFSGTGTTAAVARKMGRHYIGIEMDKVYLKSARERLNKIPLGDFKEVTVEKRKEKRIAFGSLIERGILDAGTCLISPCKKYKAKVRADGSLKSKKFEGSIHQVGAMVQGAASCNGWVYWRLDSDKGANMSIDLLRKQAREEMGL